MDAKAQVALGEWGAWLDSNFHGSERTAQLYMQLTRADPQALAGLGVEAAARRLARPRRQKPAPQLAQDETDEALEALDQADDRGPPFRTTAERSRWRAIEEARARERRTVEVLRSSTGLIPRAVHDVLREGAREHYEIAETLRLLADLVLQREGQ